MSAAAWAELWAGWARLALAPWLGPAPLRRPADAEPRLSTPDRAEPVLRPSSGTGGLDRGPRPGTSEDQPAGGLLPRGGRRRLSPTPDRAALDRGPRGRTGAVEGSDRPPPRADAVPWLEAVVENREPPRLPVGAEVTAEGGVAGEVIGHYHGAKGFSGYVVMSRRHMGPRLVFPGEVKGATLPARPALALLEGGRP